MACKYVFTKNARFNWTNIPLLYIYIFEFIVEKAGHFNQEISSKLILEIWHRNVYHIPRWYDSFFLEEMEYFGFIKRVQSQRYMFYGSHIKKAKKRLNLNKGGGAYLSDVLQEPPLLYLLFFKSMVQQIGRENRMLTGKQVINIWREFIPNVARVFDAHILVEMCNYGFIRKIDDQKYLFYGGKASTKLRKLNNLRLW